MSDWELVAEQSKLVSEPPDGLLVCVVIPDGDDQVRGITVWETPGQRGDWAASVMMTSPRDLHAVSQLYPCQSLSTLP